MKESTLQSKKFPSLKRRDPKILQVNLGYRCNQSCVHCHVNASPARSEMMDDENILLVTKVLDLYKIKTLDLTGGAPEMHSKFRSLVLSAREKNIDVIDRCNLTILSEPGQEDLGDFLAENHIIITASLPCYEEKNVDNQRGDGVFKKSIIALKKLNSLGYGLKDTGLILNLVYNPQGASLPPPQALLESSYKKELSVKYGIIFNNLYTITNMPIKRFATYLKMNGQLEEYQYLLERSFNPKNLESVMCREILSVDWQGFLYDCDFNQQLDLKINSKIHNIKELIDRKINLIGSSIQVGSHCYGCTAGTGSSCGGSLENKT